MLLRDVLMATSSEPATQSPRTRQIALSLSFGRHGRLSYLGPFRTRESSPPFKPVTCLCMPYESFDASVEAFIRTAADDPQTISIKMTTYRIGDDTPFVKSLVRAAEQGKQVAMRHGDKSSLRRRAKSALGGRGLREYLSRAGLDLIAHKLALWGAVNTCD